MKTSHLTSEEKHARRLEQKRASHARCMANPVKRVAIAAAARRRYLAEHGPSQRVKLSTLTPEQRRAHLRELRRRRHQRRMADPAYRAKAQQREISPERVLEKRMWRQAHADDLNARRRAARVADPQRFRAVERASKRRRRARRDS